jgi:hypothetical protein
MGQTIDRMLVKLDYLIISAGPGKGNENRPRAWRLAD